MKKVACLLVVLLLAAGAGGALAQSKAPPQAKGEFKTAAGESVGNVTMTQMPNGTVMVSVAVRALPPGEHGIHIHAVGSCAPTFAAAGAHYNPAQHQHGLENPNGPHAGDLPNIVVKSKSAGMCTRRTDRKTITAAPKTIFYSDVSASVSHAFMDDQ